MLPLVHVSAAHHFLHDVENRARPKKAFENFVRIGKVEGAGAAKSVPAPSSAAASDSFDSLAVVNRPFLIVWQNFVRLRNFLIWTFDHMVRGNLELPRGRNSKSQISKINPKSPDLRDSYNTNNFSQRLVLLSKIFPYNTRFRCESHTCPILKPLSRVYTNLLLLAIFFLK